MTATLGINVELSNVNHKTKKKMKRTISIAFAAFALLSFASCQKENLVSGNQEPSQRIVTAVFENSDTKTTLGTDDIPLWAEGDKICILASNDSEVIEPQESNIKESGRKVTFALTKELSGTLYAVYPASTTTMTSCSGSIDFTIPELQDGTFGSVNICVAKGDSKDNLVFSNATSVLEFSQTASSTGVLRVAVTAANAIAGKCTATFGDDNKATISTSELTGKLIWTSAPTTAQDKYYVAIAPVVTGDVNFKYYTELQEKNEAKSSKTLAQNKIYGLTIPTAGYEDSYVTIGGKKWATTNIGATTVAGSGETCFGDYYAWGEIEPYYLTRTWDGTNKIWNFKTWYTSKSSGYSWQSYCGQSSYTEWTQPPYDSGTKNLTDAYDVAKQKLGNGWRMPTKDDFQNLYEACGKAYDKNKYKTDACGESTTIAQKGVYWCGNYDGVAGVLFYDGYNRLFFPAAGYGIDTSLTYAGSRGLYWSSSLYAYTNYAYLLYFTNSYSYVDPQHKSNRYDGGSVRPVSD